MAAVTEPAVTARVLKSISVIFDPGGLNTEFRGAVSSFKFSPQSSVVTATGGTPTAVWTDMTTPTWQLAMKCYQDIEKSGSLLNYLIAHVGQAIVVVFTPSGGATVTATVVINVPDIGGDINAFMDSTITMGVRGAPAIAGTTA